MERTNTRLKRLGGMSHRLASHHLQLFSLQVIAEWSQEPENSTFPDLLLSLRHILVITLQSTTAIQTWCLTEHSFVRSPISQK